MAIKIKIPHEKDCADTKPFKFSDSFLDSFKNISDVYDTSLKELDNAIYNDSAKFAYGICNCTYKLRYITPNDISTYISCLSKGLNSCKWDSIIPLEPMWEELKRITKDSAFIVFTSSQPFTTTLISSNIDNFKYCWVWEKNRATNFPNAKRRPLTAHEEKKKLFIMLKYKIQMSYLKPLQRKNKSSGRSKYLVL
jgi:hypothetical protein